ncbi:MAG: phosphopantetheine-binding protein [Chloroflexi bacterium]|nr:phosphopantetheine-binding protein [Chloroflexota bacterium]
MSRAEIFAIVQANVLAIIEGARGKDIRETDSMRDFGADSLEIVEVVSRSMKQLQIKLPRRELSNAQNLGQLVSAFETAANQMSITAKVYGAA